MHPSLTKNPVKLFASLATHTKQIKGLGSTLGILKYTYLYIVFKKQNRLWVARNIYISNSLMQTRQFKIVYFSLQVQKLVENG